MLGDTAIENYDLIPLLNTIVKYKIEDLADNVRNQLVGKLHEIKYYC
jgi:hypothetical protein